MGECSDKISNICSKTTNLKCTKYTGLVSDKSGLDPSTCHSGFEAFEDIYKQLNELFNNLDFSSLGQSCITYEGEGTPEFLSNILLKFEESICELKYIVSKKGLDLSDLDTKCLLDACNNSPIELLDVLQLLIDRSCENTISTCCYENKVYYNSDTISSTTDVIEGTFRLSDNFNIEYTATESGRHKVSWTGLAYNNHSLNTTPTNLIFEVYKGTGSQYPTFTDGVVVPYLGLFELEVTPLNSFTSQPIKRTNFRISFDIELEVGETVSIAAAAPSDDEEVIANNLFIVDLIK